jgi:hypothetical protein
MEREERKELIRRIDSDFFDESPNYLDTWCCSVILVIVLVLLIWLIISI